MGPLRLRSLLGPLVLDSQVANLLWPFLGPLRQDQGVLEARTQAVGLRGHLAGDELRLGGRALGDHGVLLGTGGPLGRLLRCQTGGQKRWQKSGEQTCHIY